MSAPLDGGALAASLARYDEAIAKLAGARLTALDRWYRTELPGALAARVPAHATLDELVRATEWKMRRGTFRAKNVLLVRGNDPAHVVAASTAAFACADEPRKPLTALVALAGVGPATATSLLAAVRPDVHPFFDEIVARVFPELGRVAFTVPFTVRYAARLRDEAARLGPPWTAHDVGMALFSRETLGG